jgi:putative transposase
MLKEHETGVKMADLYRKYGISEATFYNWKAKYGGLEVSETKRLRGLESENAQLKKLLADAMLDNAALKDLLAKKFREERPMVHRRGRLWERGRRRWCPSCRMTAGQSTS